MLVALVARDKPDSLGIRMENRPAHREYIANSSAVRMAGPLLNAEGDMHGSLIVLEVEAMAEAEAWAANDPYATAGLFEAVTLDEWNKVTG